MIEKCKLSMTFSQKEGNKYLLNTYVPSTVLSNLQISPHLILIVLGSRCYCYSHFTEEETEADRG